MLSPRAHSNGGSPPKSNVICPEVRLICWLETEGKGWCKLFQCAGVVSCSSRGRHLNIFFKQWQMLDG